MSLPAITEKPVDTSSDEYRQDCYARYLIREIRTKRTTGERDKHLKFLLRRQSPRFYDSMRERIRRLWKETNENDARQATTKR